MSTNRHPVPELAALAAGALEKELEELPDHPTREQLEAARKRLNLPGLESLEVRPHALIDGEPCEPYDEVLGLEKAAGQKIQKVILLVRPTPRGCRETILRVATVFTGYGAYTLSFWKKETASEPDLFAGFFGDIAAPRGTGSRPGANLHRTILFQREGTEGIPANHQQLLLTPALDVSAAYLTNLVRFVDVAAARDVVVQVCLFNYHGVTGAGGIQPPTHFTFTDTDPGVRFRKFFKVGGQYQSFQANLIAKIAQALSGRWNVIWEVGNELRIPGSETSDYHNSDLTAWIAWVAQAIRQKAPQLISTSTGILTGGGVPNEQPVNQLPGLNYAAFHYGQWKTDIPGAVNRAAGYSDRHVVLDTDGSNGALVASQVQSFATQALSGTLKYRASFDHKGSTPVAIYDPSWLNQGDAGKKPVELLTALANARAAIDTIGWELIDNNAASTAIAASGNELYQLHDSGRIWKYVGPPLTGWQTLDNNPATQQIVASGGNLYQLHQGGRIWKYVGPPITGWQELDHNPATALIVADGNALYQMHGNGRIWRYTGTPITGWEELGNNPATKKIVASGGNLYQIQNNGRIWKYVSPPLTGWQELADNPASVDIVANGNDLYQMRNNGSIWKYVGPPRTGWQELDNNPATKQIAAADGRLYQLHNTGAIWRYVGPPLTGWQQLDSNPASVAILAAGGNLWQLHHNGFIWRYRP